MLLVETVRKVGLDSAISAALTPWRKARAVHDPGKILLDVALAVPAQRDREVLRLNVARLYGWPATATTYEHVEQWLRSRYCTIVWHRTRASGTLVDLVAADSMPCPAGVALYRTVRALGGSTSHRLPCTSSSGITSGRVCAASAIFA